MRSLHRPTWPRAAAWALLALAVLLGHGLLWQALRPSAGLPALQVAQKPTLPMGAHTLTLPQPEAPRPAPAQAPPRRTVSPAAVAAAAPVAPIAQPSPPTEAG